MKKVNEEATHIGQQLLIDFYQCNYDIINCVEKLTAILKEAIEICGYQILKTISHKYEPQGISVIVIIAESHFSIHTWPEDNWAAIDIFTCGSMLKKNNIIDFFSKSLGAGNYTTSNILRGNKEIAIQNNEKDIPQIKTI
jgi:S-adenosylmethionine decarboxylase